MEGSRSLEEIEINFAAFVSSARSVTFVLQKEFCKNDKFIKWYGDSRKEKVLCQHCGKTKDIPIEPPKGTKQYEMRNDPLCRFFLEQRNRIEKEGISGIEAVSTDITSFDSSTDIPEKPVGVDSTIIGEGGIFFTVYSNTPKADVLSAKTMAIVSTVFMLKDTPVVHLGKDIQDRNFFEKSKLYFEYLKSMVEEFTGIVNS